MTLFYAYLKDANSDGSWRCLITFVDRETADEWWRAISTFPSPYAGNVKRISPQFYVQNDPGNNNVVQFFNNSKLPDAKRFLEKMFFTGLDNNGQGRSLSIIQPIKITDHISGERYFIRSKDDPQKRWYYRVSGECQFRVEVRDLAIGDFQVPKDLVMIKGNKISITASKGHSVRIDDAGDLKATRVHQIASSDLLFRFGDLMNRFTSHKLKQKNGDFWEYVKPVERGTGEAWELVD